MLETVCGKKVSIQSGENPSWLIENSKSYILIWKEFQSGRNPRWSKWWKNSVSFFRVGEQFLFPELHWREVLLEELRAYPVGIKH